MARRLFVGLMLADPDGGGPARRLHELAREALGDGAPLRWYAPQDLHLTLFFAGACDQERELGLARALEEPARAAGGALELALDGAGCFPERGPARILWAGVGGRDAARLAELQRRVEQACVELGLEADERPWRPHVTLARVRGAGVRRRGRERHGGWEPPAAFRALDPRLSWQPAALALVQSLQGAGPRAYEVLRRLPLGD